MVKYIVGRVCSLSGGSMPIYTYQCDNCGVQFERQQKFTDAVLKKCPECSKSALRKVYTPVGIVFKGSGFYATDHRSPSGVNSAAHAKSEEKSSQTTTTTTSSEASSPKPAAESNTEKA